jgi:PadR family transcriptional regulator PadR
MKDDRRTQWLRGILDLCTLAVLADQERYGYELAQQLEQAGLGAVKGGTLYPLLARLEKAGHVSTQWREGQQGPHRKYYSLTRSGRRFLTTHTQDWESFAEMVESVLARGKVSE